MQLLSAVYLLATVVGNTRTHRPVSLDILPSNIQSQKPSKEQAATADFLSGRRILKPTATWSGLMT